jgi:hypothetical protein
MKKKMFLLLSISSLSFILTVSTIANTHFGTITDKPASVTFIAFFTDDDDVLTEKNIGSIYNSSTGMWGFEDSNFWTSPNLGEIGYIWLYGSNRICYGDNNTTTGIPLNWGKSEPSGSNIRPPENLTAIASNGTITLNWTTASGATKYNIYRSVTSNGAYETRVAKGITETTYTDTELEPQNYYYIVVSKDDSGNFGGHSNEATADVSTSVSSIGKLTTTWGKIKFQ